MKIINLSTDEAVLRKLGQRLAAARLQQNLTQMQLAEQAGISKSTLQRLESGEAATRLYGNLPFDKLHHLPKVVSRKISAGMFNLSTEAEVRRLL